MKTIKSNLRKHFGIYGGAFIPEELKTRFEKLEKDFETVVNDKNFKNHYEKLLSDYVGRPSPLYFAGRLSKFTGSKIYLKREDLNHTGSHKINNTLGQILLAKYMGFKEIIAETGAGQHGVATATAAALFGVPCRIFMGRKDYERQKLNVRRIKMLGAKVIPVDTGNKGLKDAVDAAFEYFISNEKSYYLIGSVVGPHPYPSIVRYFQSIIGKETKKQVLTKEGRLPDCIFASIGGGSNAIGVFSEFLDDDNVKLYAAEGGGISLNKGKTAATLTLGTPLEFQGSYSLVLTDEKGVPTNSYSIAAGLDYPGIGPEHAYLKETGRVEYFPVFDDEAVYAFKLLSELEGIIPAIESAHAVALALKVLKNKNMLAIINLSGRGDKDVERVLNM